MTRRTEIRTQFTMIEMLVVLGIIVMVAALLFGGVRVVRKKNYESKTRYRMEKIIEALEVYRDDYGYYPANQTNVEDDLKLEWDCGPTKNGGIVIGSLPPLKRKGATGTTPLLDWGSVAYSNELGSLDSNQQDYCLDASEEEPFYYRCPGKMNSESYDLWAPGFDKKHGDDGSTPTDAWTHKKTDDIRNWD